MKQVATVDQFRSRLLSDQNLLMTVIVHYVARVVVFGDILAGRTWKLSGTPRFTKEMIVRPVSANSLLQFVRINNTLVTDRNILRKIRPR